MAKQPLSHQQGLLGFSSFLCKWPPCGEDCTAWKFGVWTIPVETEPKSTRKAPEAQLAGPWVSEYRACKMHLVKTELLIIHPDLLHLSSSRLSLSDFPHISVFSTAYIWLHTRSCWGPSTPLLVPSSLQCLAIPWFRLPLLLWSPRGPWTIVSSPSSPPDHPPDWVIPPESQHFMSLQYWEMSLTGCLLVQTWAPILFSGPAASGLPGGIY